MTQPRGRWRIAAMGFIAAAVTSAAGMVATSDAGAAPSQTVDVLFVFDTTGSMGSALAEAKTQVSNAVASVRSTYPDSDFGLATVADYDAGDTPWALKQPITADSTKVQAALDPLTVYGGGDAPEAYGRALYEAANNSAVGWRDGAKHILILVNDDVPHDNDLNEGVPADVVNQPSPWNTGVDPGPDGINGTADDIDWQAQLASLKAKGIIFATVLYSGNSSYLPYWQWWTKQTGGSTTTGGGATTLGEILANLIDTTVSGTGLPVPGQVVCSRTAAPGDGDGWSYTARMTASEGLSVENVHYGPRLAARLITVPYLRAQGFGRPGSIGHLTTTPDPADTDLQGKLLKVDCSPSGSTVSALYEVTSSSTNRIFVVQQTYHFESYAADGRPCEATETAKCAKFWPTTTWALADGQPINPSWGLNIVQRFEFDPDGVGATGAADVIQDTLNHSNLGVNDLADGGALKREDVIDTGTNSGPVIRQGVTVHWDNWHQTGRDHVGLPSPFAPGCSECIHVHWSWFGSLSGVSLKASNFISCGSLNCWSDGKPEILDGSKQTDVAGWAIANPGERQPTNWRSLVNPKNSPASKVDHRRLVLFWDAQTSAGGSPTGGVTIDGIHYPVGDSYWPQLASYVHGGNGGMFLDPARKFRTVAHNPGGSDAVVTPDFSRASAYYSAPAGSRIPSGYVLPVRITLATSPRFPISNAGPYYLRVKSTAARLLNADSLYSPNDGGQPWLRIYDDTLNKAGNWTLASDSNQLMAYPGSRNYMLALAVFDHPPTAADVSFELDAAPDGVDSDYVPTTGNW